MDNDIKVSVFLIAYNQEDLIETALKSIIMQKTNFRYEIFVHDDASTDNTPNIIKKYAEQYPELIKPIFQTENQYSKGVNVAKEYLCPLSKGKYIALLEGDDCWTDEYKLQLQYNFMEAHQKCALCAHNTSEYDFSVGKIIKNVNNWSKIKKIKIKDILNKWNVHTSSFFMKADCYLKKIVPQRYVFGDLSILTSCFYFGEVWVLPNVMSMYRKNYRNGVTLKMWDNIEKYIETTYNFIDYYVKYDKLTAKKYNKDISKSILYHFRVLSRLKTRFLCEKKEYKSVRMALREIKNTDVFKEYYSSTALLNKVITKIKMSFLYRLLSYKLKKK